MVLHAAAIEAKIFKYDIRTNENLLFSKRNIFLGFFKLLWALIKKIHIRKDFSKNKLCIPTDSSPNIKCIIRSRKLPHKLSNNFHTVSRLHLMVLSVPSKDAINRRRLLIPILLLFVIPFEPVHLLVHFLIEPLLILTFRLFLLDFQLFKLLNHSIFCIALF